MQQFTYCTCEINIHLYTQTYTHTYTFCHGLTSGVRVITSKVTNGYKTFSSCVIHLDELVARLISLFSYSIEIAAG